MRFYRPGLFTVLVFLVVSLTLSACGDTAPTTTLPTNPASEQSTPAAIAVAPNTSASFVINATTLDQSDSVIPVEYLDKARKLRVLFTHQSVGGNILEGLQDLSQQKSDRYAISIEADVAPDWYKTNTGIGEFTPGQNEKPLTKTSGFKELIDAKGYGKMVDVAMMKLCYVDFENPTATWNSYRDTMLYLEKKYPNVRYVWWTMPVADKGLNERETYNKLVRDYAKANNKILFDIADIESSDPQGRRVTNNGVQALFAGYTDDGGHLNSAASQRVARGIWWLLARLTGWNGV
jgi:hypothetical protein